MDPMLKVAQLPFEGRNDLSSLFRCHVCRTAGGYTDNYITSLFYAGSNFS
jgi:hypothetical protein